MKRIRIPLDPGMRMLRIGFGQQFGRWFFRVDLWWVGWRFTASRQAAE